MALIRLGWTAVRSARHPLRDPGPTARARLGFDTRGATAALPGDDLTPDAAAVTTRAVTIRAPATAVWPWLVQMGQDRAGFYTHNWVERLLRSGIPDVDEVHPEWQQLAAGDLMRTNRDIGGKPMGWPVLAVDPGRSIVVRSKSLPVGTYAFVLQPIDDTTTRFIVRDRAAWRRREWLFKVLVYEPLHAYMETGVMSGLKRRTERARGSSGRQAPSEMGGEPRSDRSMSSVEGLRGGTMGSPWSWTP